VLRRHGACRLNDTAKSREVTLRPPWMKGLAVFCLLTVAFLVPRDLFYPETRDVEVWFGFEVRGGWALLTAPLHWGIFGVGAWGFWHHGARVLPWAAGYVFYVALSHIIWNQTSPNGQGWLSGILQALVISIPGILMLRARYSIGRRCREEV